MRRAVFSFVMEQMSFSRTVSCTSAEKRLHTHVNAPRPDLTETLPARQQSYQCFPAEDVAIETDPVLREVESSLQEDVPLESTGVV